MEEKYVIVEFPEESENGTIPMAVVSTKWLEYDENENCVYCYWPTFFKTDQLRLKAVEQHRDIKNKNSQKNIVNVKYKTAIYTKAIEKLKVLETYQSLSESEDSDESLDKKRRSVPNKKLENYLGGYSSSEEVIPEAPKLPKLSTSASTLSSCMSTPSSCMSIPSSCMSMPTSHRSLPTSSKSIPTPSRSLRTISPPPSRTSTPTSQISCTGCEQNKALMIQILEKVEKMRRDVQVLTNYCGQNSMDSNTPNTENLDELKKNTKEELIELDSKLEDPSEMQSVVSLLQLIGGRDVLDTTRRIMGRILTNSLACEFNWTGKHDKGSFTKLKNVKALITVTVRKNKFCSGATEDEVERAMKIWLRNAPDRDGGRSKRKKAAE